MKNHFLVFLRRLVSEEGQINKIFHCYLHESPRNKIEIYPLINYYVIRHFFIRSILKFESFYFHDSKQRRLALLLWSNVTVEDIKPQDLVKAQMAKSKPIWWASKKLMLHSNFACKYRNLNFSCIANFVISINPEYSRTRRI